MIYLVTLAPWWCSEQVLITGHWSLSLQQVLGTKCWQHQRAVWGHVLDLRGHFGPRTVLQGWALACSWSLKRWLSSCAGHVGRPARRMGRVGFQGLMLTVLCLGSCRMCSKGRAGNMLCVSAGGIPVGESTGCEEGSEIPEWPAVRIYSNYKHTAISPTLLEKNWIQVDCLGVVLAWSKCPVAVMLQSRGSASASGANWFGPLGKKKRHGKTCLWPETSKVLFVCFRLFIWKRNSFHFLSQMNWSSGEMVPLPHRLPKGMLLQKPSSWIGERNRKTFFLLS